MRTSMRTIAEPECVPGVKTGSLSTKPTPNLRRQQGTTHNQHTNPPPSSQYSRAARTARTADQEHEQRMAMSWAE